MSFLAQWERVDDEDGIMAVANFTISRHSKAMSLKFVGKEVSGYEVFLPKYLSGTASNYAEHLLSHPHPKVRCRFTVEDL